MIQFEWHHDIIVWWYVRTRVCRYTHMYPHVYVRTRVCTDTIMYAHVYVRTHLCTHASMYGHIYVRICLCTHTHLYTHAYVHTRVCAYTRLYTHGMYMNMALLFVNHSSMVKAYWNLVHYVDKHRSSVIYLSGFWSVWCYRKYAQLLWWLESLGYCNVYISNYSFHHWGDQ